MKGEIKITTEQIANMSPKEQYEARIGEFETDDKDEQIQYLEEEWFYNFCIPYHGSKDIIPSELIIGWFHEPITDKIRLPSGIVLYEGDRWYDAKTIGIQEQEKLQPDPDYIRHHDTKDVLHHFPIVFRYDKNSDKEGTILARPEEILNSKPLLDAYTFLTKELSKNEAVSIERDDLPECISKEELYEIDWEYKCIDVGEKAYMLGLMQGKNI